MPPAHQRVSDHDLKIPLYNIGGAIPPYMQRLHKIQCDMIEEFINICGKYGLQYFAISGTALGAVRHGGFIPWDDDVAFAMPRKDYDTFIRVAPENLSSHLFLQTYNTEPGYQRYFAKIRNSDTAFIEVNAKADGLNRGVFIDVYPLDGFPGNKLKQWQCIAKHYVFEACIAFLCNDFEMSEIFLRPTFTKKIVARLVGFVMMNTKYRGSDLKKLNIAKEKYFTQFDYRESEHVTSYGGIDVSKEVLPREYYGEGTKMAFEQFQISVPEKYQDYLSHLYGNYMVVPDEKKRLVNNPKEIVDLDRSYRFYR